MGLLFALPLYDASRHLVTSCKFPPPTNHRANTEEPAHQFDQSQSAYSRRSAAHCRPASATRRCIRQPDAVPGLGCDSRAARKTQTNHRDQSVTKEQENRSGWNRKCPRLDSAPFWPVKRAKARTHGVCMCALALSRACVSGWKSADSMISWSHISCKEKKDTAINSEQSRKRRIIRMIRCTTSLCTTSHSPHHKYFLLFNRLY